MLLRQCPIESAFTPRAICKFLCPPRICWPVVRNVEKGAWGVKSPEPGGIGRPTVGSAKRATPNTFSKAVLRYSDWGAV